jgi:DNA (cytosine-5)-methyltransferase 1
MKSEALLADDGGFASRAPAQLRLPLMEARRPAAAYYRLQRPERIRSRKHTAIDLFSGAGGISLGLANAGFDVLLASDVSEACAVTHSQSMPSIQFLHADIRRLSPSDVMRAAGVRPGELDLLIGGPPCQGFSIIGQREHDDPRNAMIEQFFRIAKGTKPKFVVIENVPGLATLHRGAFLRQIGAGFKRLGYRAHCAELLAAQYGVPQMRWRMFFVGVRENAALDLPGFPPPTHGWRGIGELVPNRTVRPEDSDGFITLAEAIGDLGPVCAGTTGDAYQSRAQCDYQRGMRVTAGRRVENHYAAKMSAANLQRFKFLKPGQDWRDLPRELLPAGMQRALLKDHTRRFRRMTWDGVPRSIITRFRDPKSGEYIHPTQDRTISIREAARIQSFPDWFVFHGSITSQYEQVGNAVPPLLAREVGREISLALQGVVRPSPFRSRYRMYA